MRCNRRITGFEQAQEADELRLFGLERTDGNCLLKEAEIVGYQVPSHREEYPLVGPHICLGRGRNGLTLVEGTVVEDSVRQFQLFEGQRVASWDSEERHLLALLINDRMLRLDPEGEVKKFISSYPDGQLPPKVAGESEPEIMCIARALVRLEVTFDRVAVHDRNEHLLANVFSQLHDGVDQVRLIAGARHFNMRVRDAFRNRRFVLLRPTQKLSENQISIREYYGVDEDNRRAELKTAWLGARAASHPLQVRISAAA